MARAEIPRLADHVYLAPTKGPNAVGTTVTELFKRGIRPADSQLYFGGKDTVFKRTPARQTAARWTDYVQSVAATAAPRSAWLVRRSAYPDPDIFTFEITMLIVPPIPPIELFYTPAVTSINVTNIDGTTGTIPRAGTADPRAARPTPYHEIVAWERGAYDIDLMVLITERKEVLISPTTSQ